MLRTTGNSVSNSLPKGGGLTQTEAVKLIRTHILKLIPGINIVLVAAVAAEVWRGRERRFTPVRGAEDKKTIEMAWKSYICIRMSNIDRASC